MRTQPGSFPVALAAGDTAVLAIFTVVGFATHGEFNTAGLGLLAMFVPLCMAWALVTPWLGLYSPGVVQSWREQWRVLLAALIVAPLAGWLRAYALGSVVIPLFILVMAAMVAALDLLWRLTWLALSARRRLHG